MDSSNGKRRLEFLLVGFFFFIKRNFPLVVCKHFTGSSGNKGRAYTKTENDCYKYLPNLQNTELKGVSKVSYNHNQLCSCYWKKNKHVNIQKCTF